MKYKIKIRWPCDHICHNTLSTATCHVCKEDIGWDAQAEASVGYPYTYVENRGGGAVIYLDFYEDDDTPIVPRDYLPNFLDEEPEVPSGGPD